MGGGGGGAVSQLGTVSQPLKFLSGPILMYRGVLFTLSGSGCGKVGTGNRIAPDRTKAYLFTVLSSDQFMSEPHFTIVFCRGINSFRANQFVLLTQGPQEKSLADSLIKLKCSFSRTLPLLSMNGQNLGGRPQISVWQMDSLTLRRRRHMKSKLISLLPRTVALSSSLCCNHVLFKKDINTRTVR